MCCHVYRMILAQGNMAEFVHTGMLISLSVQQQFPEQSDSYFLHSSHRTHL